MFAAYFILNDIKGSPGAKTCLRHKCSFRLPQVARIRSIFVMRTVYKSNAVEL